MTFCLSSLWNGAPYPPRWRGIGDETERGGGLARQSIAAILTQCGPEARAPRQLHPTPCGPEARAPRQLYPTPCGPEARAPRQLYPTPCGPEARAPRKAGEDGHR